MKLGAGEFLRFFYWAIRRNRRDALHMLSVLPSFIHNAGRLRRLATGPRPLLAIALVEHIGDIVVAEPIARLARQRHPGARIVWITRAPFVSLPANYPDVDAVLGVVCLTEWMLLQRLDRFTEIWDLHIDGRICPHCGIPQHKPGVRLNAENYFEAGSLLDMQCECAGLPRLTDGPTITPPPQVVAAVDRLDLPPNFIAIHCVSSDIAKDWPLQNWQGLIKRIEGKYQVSFIEVGTRPLVIVQPAARQMSLCGSLSLLETTELIRRAKLFIGIDSGPAHLANAVGTKASSCWAATEIFARTCPIAVPTPTAKTPCWSAPLVPSQISMLTRCSRQYHTLYHRSGSQHPPLS